MTRDPQAHLSPEELAFLSGERESVSSGDRDRQGAEVHAETCTLCGSRLRSHRLLQANLRNLAVTVAADQKPVCPPEQTWIDLAAGLSSVIEARTFLEHASHCDHCGPILRAASEIMNPEVSDEERELIRKLPTVETTWQRRLAEKMARSSAEQLHREPATPAIPSTTDEGPKTVAEKKPPTSALMGSNWLISNWARWIFPLGAAAVACVVFLYMWYFTPSLSSTNQLIAQAYTELRPFEARFMGAEYGPLREQRGESEQSRSRMAEPVELLQADERIGQALIRHPQDSRWLQSKARIEMLEGKYQAAVEKLVKAQSARSQDVTIQIDLAIAYYARAGTQRDTADKTSDYQRSLHWLNMVLSKNPDEAVALFNRAIVHKELKQYAEATSDWQHYLHIDPSSRWADEAAREMQKTNKNSETR